ncbi:hypothetical protein GEMRC1_001137 [Eukaryota sp. GEM-RC1]
MTWAWLKAFIKEADNRNDLRALEFVCPFFSKVDDILIDDVMAITTEEFKTLVKYCTSTQSLTWFIKSLVSSILNQNFDLNEVPNFTQTRKHSELHVSEDSTRVVVGTSGDKWRSILGEDPLLPGNDYTWKLRYQGRTISLFVGVIDESKFSVDDACYVNAHGIFNGNGNYYGCLSGTSTQWNPGSLLEININLIDYILTIKSVSNSSINLTGTLPRLSSGNYYPFASLYWAYHELEIFE